MSHPFLVLEWIQSRIRHSEKIIRWFPTVICLVSIWSRVPSSFLKGPCGNTAWFNTLTHHHTQDDSSLAVPDSGTPTTVEWALLVVTVLFDHLLDIRSEAMMNSTWRIFHQWTAFNYIDDLNVWTAKYLFTILPVPPTEFRSRNTVTRPPTNTNLSFTLDNQPAGNFFSGTESDNQPSTNVLSLDGLSNQLHQLVVTVGDNSIFIFDYLIYTNSSAVNSAPQPTTPK